MMNKLSLLKQINESESDFFSNVDVDAFAEKPKTRREELDDVAAKEQRTAKRLKRMQDEFVSLKNATRRNQTMFWYNASNVNPNLVSLKELFPGMKFPGSTFRQAYEKYYADKTDTQLIAKIRTLLTRAERATQQLKYLSSKRQRLNSQVNKSGLSDMRANTPKTTIDPSNVPSVVTFAIRTIGSKSPKVVTLDNPYYHGTGTPYAGHPAHFPWSGKHTNLFATIDAKMKAYGIPPFDTLYGNVDTSGSKPRISYFVTNPHGTVVMYAYSNGRPSLVINKDRYSVYNIREQINMVDEALKKIPGAKV